MTQILSRIVFTLIGFTLIAACGFSQGDSNDDDAEVQICAGIQGLPCDTNEYCNLGVGNCCCDFQGVCEEIPEACIQIFDPVCGCDGTTYGNDCEAARAGVSVDFEGDCDRE